MQIFNIGRDASNQIVLNDSMVSRKHAQLYIHDDGKVLIRDAGSSNGTFVNGNKIQESYLNPGDVVKCGSVFLNWAQYVQHVPTAGSSEFSMVAEKAQAWNNKFLSFIRPFLGTIDDGSFFRKVFYWLYIAIALFNIVFPFYILFTAINNNLFKLEGKPVITFLLLWVVLTLLCWFGFQLWWNRRERVNESSYHGAEFVATPVLAHLLQTLGEWYGVLVGVLGFMTGLLALFLGGRNSTPNFGTRNDFDDSFIPIPFFSQSGWQLIFLGPLAGFMIVFLFRFISESIKALSVIANNTKSISKT